jgi:hypothetical protein
MSPPKVLKLVLLLSRHWHRHVCLDGFMPNHRQVSSVGRHEVPSQGKSVSSGEQTLVKLQILKQHKERGEIFFKPLEQSIDGTWRWYQEARHLVIW